MGEVTPAIEQPILEKPKQSFMESLFCNTFSPERSTELISAQIMMGLEIVHDQRLDPAKHKFTPDQVGTLPNPETDPIAAWAIDHIGDIWEISVGFTVMRLGFVAANEVLKKVPAAKGYQIPDEACFWASLASAITVTATHSLGMWAGPYNSHVGHPVPEMIFGQGVAAVVLAASHYAAKHREPIKDLVIRGGSIVAEKFHKLDTMMNNFGASDVAPNAAADGRELKQE
jgi:hypothetical protein